MHDATVALLDQPSYWQTGPHEPAEVICHNDFAPYNMVFRQQRLVGIIDFDRAAPGPRLWGLAFLAYHLVPLSEGGMSERMRAERLRLLLEAFGTDAQPSDLIAVAAERLVELAGWTDESRAPDIPGRHACARGGLTRWRPKCAQSFRVCPNGRAQTTREGTLAALQPEGPARKGPARGSSAGGPVPEGPAPRGAPCRIRTDDPRFTRAVLWPAELRGRSTNRSHRQGSEENPRPTSEGHGRGDAPHGTLPAAHEAQRAAE